MKKKLAFLLILLIASLSVFADIYEDIASAIRMGNSKQLASFFNNTVDLTISNQEDIYSKAQAEVILRDFFTKNPPKSFNILHQGNSKEGAKYTIGTLATTQGNFRTYFFVKNIQGKFFIQELRFEKE